MVGGQTEGDVSQLSSWLQNVMWCVCNMPEMEGGGQGEAEMTLEYSGTKDRRNGATKTIAEMVVGNRAGQSPITEGGLAQKRVDKHQSEARRSRQVQAHSLG